MSTKMFGFIGCGNMGGALARAVSKSAEKQEIIVTDTCLEKAQQLASELSCEVGTTLSVAQNAKYIFLGVKPQVMKSLIEEITPVLEKREDRFILVSMAAGIKIANFNEMSGHKFPTIRIMPNTPVSVGEGMILYSLCKVITEFEEQEFVSHLKFAGRLDKLNEELIDAGCAISGCGPAFVYMFAESMAAAGEKLGLQGEKAIEYAAQTLLGAAKLMLNSNKTPLTLRQEVCSPGGATIEGVHSLENSNLKSVVEKAINASFNRTVELGK